LGKKKKNLYSSQVKHAMTVRGKFLRKKKLSNKGNQKKVSVYDKLSPGGRSKTIERTGGKGKIQWWKVYLLIAHVSAWKRKGEHKENMARRSANLGRTLQRIKKSSLTFGALNQEQGKTYLRGSQR